MATPRYASTAPPIARGMLILRSVRGRASLLTGLMVITVMLIAGVLLGDSARRYRESTERQLSSTARALNLAVDAEIGKAESILRTIAASPAMRDGDFAAVDRQARLSIPDKSMWLVVSNMYGEQVVNTYKPLGAELDAARPDAFSIRWARLHQEGEYVADLSKGVAYPSYIVGVNALGHDRAGNDYAMAVVIKPEVISRLLARQALPERWYSIVFDRNGTIIAHNVASSEFVGRSATPEALKLIKAGQSGLIKSISIGGTKSLVVLDRSPLTHWSVGVTMPKAEATAFLSRSINLLILSAALTLLAGGLLSFLLGRGTARAVDQVVQAAQRLGDGALVEAGPSTGMHETDVIATAIQAASVQLRTREAELTALNETLEARVAETAAKLVQAQKMDTLGQLTGGVAHDFNNLLSPIIGGLDRLQRGGLTEERSQRAISGALEAAERAKTLVHRLLAFARRQPLQPTAVDLTAAVEGMRELLISTLGPRVEIVVNSEPELPPAKADPNQLELAILNLTVNARDAMPEGGRLTIALARATAEDDPELAIGDYVSLTMTDTGEGMDEDVRRRAIEPFFSTKGVGRGTGLGLSMVHGLAAQLGGALQLTSIEGQGASVKLILPVAEELAQPRSAPVSTAPPAGFGTVLLVEDDALVRASTAAMLADLGYAVVETISAREALAVLEGGINVDALVTDHLMPGITGAELARAVRARWPSVEVLIISGYADVDHIAADLPRLVKPFRQADLAASLAALGDHRARSSS